MELILKKQPQKYLASVDKNVRNKLYIAIEGLRELSGDIVKLKGTKNFYRLKIPHYRILFTYDSKKGEIIVIETINTRTNIKY